MIFRQGVENDLEKLKKKKKKRKENLFVCFRRPRKKIDKSENKQMGRIIANGTCVIINLISENPCFILGLDSSFFPSLRFVVQLQLKKYRNQKREMCDKNL